MFTSYDDYKNRIEKVAKIKNFVVRFKFLIIGVLAVIIGGVTTLLVMKGTVTSPMTMPTSVVYGDSYSPAGATAFLSGVSYQYASEDAQDWTFAKPVKAGKYLVRTVTDRTGGQNYGEPVAFEILKKQVTFEFVNDATDDLIYGAAPDSGDYIMTGLIAGDRISGAEFDYSYDDENRTVEVSVKSGDIKIYGAGADDRSDCYEYAPQTTEYILKPRPLTFRLADEAQTYTGKPLSAEGRISDATLQSLVGADEFGAIETEVTNLYGVQITAVNADVYLIGLKNKSVKILSGGKDITESRYEINIENSSGTFTVNKKEMTITTADDEKVYDGTELTSAERVQTGLLDGHEIRPSRAASSIKEAGSTPNIQQYDVYDTATGDKVTDNYKIGYIYGTLTVTPRPATVKTYDGEWVYDGNEKSNGENEITGLADGQSIKVTGSTRQTDYTAGVTNELYFEIRDGSGAVVSKNNYNFTYDYGTLTIKRRPVTVRTATASYVYDGNPKSNGEPTVTGDTALVPLHNLSIIGAAFSVTNVSDTAAGNNKNKYRIYGGGRDLTGNYEITYDYGTLTVTPRPITVERSPAQKEYDGTPLSCADQYTTYYYEVVGKAGLIGGDKLTVDGVAPEITSVGEIKNEVKFIAGNNYEIKEYSGNATLKITPRPIIVEVLYAEKEYDGAPFSSTAYSTRHEDGVKAGLIGGDKLTAVAGSETTVTDAGITTNGVKFTSDTNYEIKGYEGRDNLVITQREVRVRIKNVTAIYGEPYEYVQGGESLEGAFVAGETFKFTVNLTGELLSVGTYPIVDNGKSVTKRDGSDSTGNYKISFEQGALTITERPITVKSDDGEWTYDGKTYSNDGFVVTKDENSLGLVEGQKITVTGRTFVTDYTQNTPNALTYKIEHNGDVTANYKITPVSGVLKINKRSVKIKLKDGLTEIYGEAITYPAGEDGYKITSGSFVSGESFTFAVSYYDASGAPVDPAAMPAVGVYNIKVKENDYAITKSNGDDGKQNYTVDFTAGELSVTEREITVKSRGNEFTYNGEAQFEKGFDIISDTGVAAGQIIEVTAWTEVTSVCENIKNEQDYKITHNGNVVTKNYIITPEYGTLTVKRRAVTVKLGNATAVYGDTEYFYNGGETISDPVNHTFTVDYSQIIFDIIARPTVNDTGRVKCDRSAITVKNAAGDNTTANFDITVENGTLTITQKLVTVELTGVNDKPYDGSPLEYADENKALTEGLAYGQKLIFEVTFKNDKGETGKNAGEYTAALDSDKSKIVNGDGNEVADGLGNYIITCNKVTAKITPRKITVTPLSFTGDNAKVYIGDYYEYVQYFGNYEKCRDYDNPDAEGLVAGERLRISVTFDGKYSRVIDAGEYSVEFAGIAAVYGNNHPENYEVVNGADNAGKFEIKKFVVTVKAEDESYIYGSEIREIKTPLIKQGENKWLVNETPLFHGVEIREYHYYKDNIDASCEALAAGSYYIALDEIIIKDGSGKEVTENYTVIPDHTGTLSIVPLNITLVTATHTWEYDGKEHYDTSFTLEDNDGNEIILLPHEYELIKVVSYKTVCDAVNDVKNWVEYDFTATNYEIKNTSAGTLKVTPRAISLETSDKEKDYDGDPLSCADEFADLDIEDSAFYFKRKGDAPTITDAGSIANKQEFDIYLKSADPDVADKLVTTNFLISYHYGTLTVNRRKIDINLLDIAGEKYDGTVIGYPYRAGNFTYAEGSDTLVDGEVLTVGVAFYSDVDCLHAATPKNAGVYYYKLYPTSCKLDASKGKNPEGVIGNYLINCSAAEPFEISKRAITVTLAPLEPITYDGAEHAYSADNVTCEGDFAAGETISPAFYYYLVVDDGKPQVSAPKNAYTYKIGLDREKSTIGGENAQTNYDVTCEETEFIINKRALNITLGDEGRVYNAAYYDYLTESKNRTAEGLALREVFLIKTVSYTDENGNAIAENPKNAGEYGVKIEDYGIINGDIANYTVAFYNGEGNKLTDSECKLTISPKKLTVVVTDRKAEYGTDKVIADESCTGDNFAGGDGALISKEYSYAQNGETVTPYKVGKYDINLEFTGDDALLANYDIKVESGVLEIILRQVGVKPVYDGDPVVYDGAPMEITEAFKFDHWHAGEEGVSGFLDGYEKTLTPIFTFTDEDGNSFTSTGAAPVDAGEYTLEISFDKDAAGFEEDGYQVEYFEADAKFIIARRSLTVITSVNGNFGGLGYSHEELPTDGISVTVSGDGIAEKDGGVSISTYLYNVTRDEKTATQFAGKYEVRAELTGDGSENYEISESSVWAKFEVARRSIYIKPKDKQLPYEGDPISLNSDEWEYVGGDAVDEDKKLLDGDELDVTGSETLYPTNATKKITIGSASVSYQGADVTSCYNIIGNYDETDGYIVEKGFKRADFKGTLSYEKRALTYKLTVPDVRSFTYTGEEVVLTKDGEPITAATPYLIESDGLLEGDRIEITKISYPKNSGAYTDWVRFKIYRDKTDVTSCYARTLDAENKAATQITVSKIILKFELHGVDTDALLSDFEDGGNIYFENIDKEKYEGHKVLKAGYYSLVSNLEGAGVLDGQNFEVLAAIGNGGLILKVIVFEEDLSDAKRKDKSSGYEVAGADITLTPLYKLTLKTEA